MQPYFMFEDTGPKKSFASPTKMKQYLYMFVGHMEF